MYSTGNAKNADRIIKKEINKMDKYVCTACMYVYDPTEHDNVPFDKLPEDYVCPICGVSKEMFEIQED